MRIVLGRISKRESATAVFCPKVYYGVNLLNGNAAYAVVGRFVFFRSEETGIILLRDEFGV